ncbi:apolipoprotein N-acyltransferase [Pelomonas sp. SE-A7]|uniref:apolipoprotein N-acyltransferase n=1 Tax=Pelomonas sp. SE-A7 TaxID=3054953 RepID=UPI00259D2C51|nr:apolipoprotein N-acyltransferase [Pelomonas sp. SE-A7]MDM4767901.1 apolipoprotein N-acyltransferase [Pelomonas sp. SE-A7]
MLPAVNRKLLLGLDVLGAWPVVLLAGVLHTASFSPGHAWPLQLLAVALLAHASWDQRPARAFRHGLVFGLGWLASGLWWLYISLHDFGHLPSVLAGAAVLLLAFVLSLYYGAALALAAWLRDDRHPAVHALVWAGCWLAAELARAQWLTGFPWIASGYAHAVGPLAGWAPWVGVYGIVALAGLLSAGVAAALRSSGRVLMAALLLVGLGLVLPQQFTESSGKLRVSLLQPNVPQDQKFNAGLMADNLDKLVGQIEAARGQLVLTPESVVPLPMDWLEKDFPDQAARLRKAAAERPVLLGIFLGNPQDGYVNSLLGLGTEQAYSYGKRHLLPFGESIPPGFRWFVKALGIPMDDQARGDHQRPLPVAGQRIRPLICYEDLFGEDFVASVQDDAEAATLLLNVSNLAWFGPRMVQDQHLQFSQMRALEFQRPFIRSTNTGATAVLDHQGKVLARLPVETRDRLEIEVEGRRGATPYARWLAAVGLWPLWALALAPILWAWRGRRKR